MSEERTVGEANLLRQRVELVATSHWHVRSSSRNKRTTDEYEPPADCAGLQRATPRRSQPQTPVRPGLAFPLTLSVRVRHNFG
jgi:hypothetical protein